MHGFSDESTTAHLAAVLAAPSIEHLTLRDVTLSSFSQPASPTTYLREFSMSFSHRLSDVLTMSPEVFATEMACLQSFLEPMRQQFTTLRLPGESMRLSFLAASPWPLLRELTICGARPTLDVPFSQVLHAMPELRSVALAVAHPHAAPPLILLPEGAIPSPNLCHLRRFVISFPHPEDRIFQYLPVCLRELSLRDTPRHWYRKTHQFGLDQLTESFGSPLLTCHGAMRIFSVMQCANLERLELVVREDEYEEQMLDQVARACPRLHFLELHRYRIGVDNEVWGSPAVVTVVRLA